MTWDGRSRRKADHMLDEAIDELLRMDNQECTCGCPRYCHQDHRGSCLVCCSPFRGCKKFNKREDQR